MKIRRKKGIRVYLSGPMSHIEDFNRPAFDAAAAQLRSQGFQVFVPGENEEVTEEELVSMKVSRQKLQAYLSRDIDVIQEWADVVVVLPGWLDSDGCKLEAIVAWAVGVPVFTFPDAVLIPRHSILLQEREEEEAA